MRQGLAPSPWKKRVVNFGHLLCLCWTTLQSSPTQWALAPSSTFGAFSLAPLFLAFVGKCVGVQGYKGSYFLSFYHPALSFARLMLLATTVYLTNVISTHFLFLSYCFYPANSLLTRTTSETQGSYFLPDRKFGLDLARNGKFSTLTLWHF